MGSRGASSGRGGGGKSGTFIVDRQLGGGEATVAYAKELRKLGYDSMAVPDQNINVEALHTLNKQGWKLDRLTTVQQPDLMSPKEGAMKNVEAIQLKYSMGAGKQVKSTGKQYIMRDLPGARDVATFSNYFKKEGYKNVAITSTSAGLTSTLHAFKSQGWKVSGLTTVKQPRPGFPDQLVDYEGILLTR